MAQHLNCQTSYIAQVFNVHAHLSLEQAQKLSDFLLHSEDEQHYFLLLVNLARADTQKLKLYFKKQIQKCQEGRKKISNRINKAKNLSKEHMAEYYSSWVYSAIHVALSVPHYQTVDELQKLLKISKRQIKETLDFLVKTGLANVKGNQYCQGVTTIHLPSDSPYINQHHFNWKLKALQEVASKKDQTVFYSSVISASESDAAEIHEILLRAIEEIRKIVRESKEEKVYAYGIDWFPLSDLTEN